MRVSREIRFSLTSRAVSGPVGNSWAGWPAHDGLGPYLRLAAVVSGSVDSATGYLCNITLIDRLLRERAIPLLQRAWAKSPAGGIAAEGLLTGIAQELAAALPPAVNLDGIELQATPFLAYTFRTGASDMVSVTQSFEFSAAHRLCCRELDDAKNRELFGKCANVNGHGHNYVVEVTVAGSPEAATGRAVDLQALERSVKSNVIDVFDHKHLNQDCAEFAELNPTVENITRVIWEKLEGGFADGRLEAVRVYETPKTWAEYRGGKS